MKQPQLRRLILVFLLLVLSTLSVAVADAQTSERCFSNTGQCISGRFRVYWEQNGGLPIFGYPITSTRNETSLEDNRTYQTQWFERARFELHSENAAPYDVLLGRLGNDRLRQLKRDWQSEPREPSSKPGCLWFAETGHNICNQDGRLGFMAYWQTHGLLDPHLSRYGRSLGLFGLPLTEARSETNPTNGQTYITQWFERARFEWHPQEATKYKVLLGLLGQEIQLQGGSDNGGSGNAGSDDGNKEDTLKHSALCPEEPDRDRTTPIAFGPITNIDTSRGTAFVRTAPYVHPDLKQTFVITVTARRIDVLADYTDNLRACLVAEQPQFIERELGELPPRLSALDDPLLDDPNTENLIIEFDLNDPGWIKELPKGYTLSFVFDPKMNGGYTHVYRKYRLNRANATIWMGLGLGKVTGDLLKNGTSTGTTTISKPDHQSLPQGSGTATYGLQVTGIDTSNKYRVSGTWNCGYDQPLPTGPRPPGCPIN